MIQAIKEELKKKDDDANKTIWEMLYYDNSTKHIGLELLLKGYDLVILDLPDGGGYIEQMPWVCIEVLIKSTNLDISGSKEEIVIIDPVWAGKPICFGLYGTTFGGSQYQFRQT